MRHADRLVALMRADALRMAALQVVAALFLPDGWIGAGFVRDAVWDHLHGFPPTPPRGDVDILWFGDAGCGPDEDAEIEAQLRVRMPSLDWSVKNQVRMHRRNGDRPYQSVTDAMAHWPESATAVAVRLTGGDVLEVSAPFGLDDLYALRLVPTAEFATAKRDLFDARVRAKDWLARYPQLSLM